MAWNRILNYENIKKILQRAILAGKIPNAYIFSGIAGIGKDAVALELAKVLNCTSPVIEGENINSCDNCNSCKSMKTLSHPNVDIIFSLPVPATPDTKKDDPLAKMSSAQIDEIKEQLQLKSEDPYHKMNFKDSVSIKIASIRDIKRKLSLGAPADGRRFVIISNADEMTNEAANAFLKTLEEPHSNITIVLTTSKIEKLLPTILSRCQHIPFKSLPDDVIYNELIAKYSLNAEDAKIVSSFAMGSWSKACSFIETDIRAVRDEIIDIFRACLKKGKYRIELIDRITALTKGGDKTTIETSLSLLMIWLRDSLILKEGGSVGHITNLDHANIIERFIANFPNADIDSAIHKINDTINDIRGNITRDLALATLFLYIREIFLD